MAIDVTPLSPEQALVECSPTEEEMVAYSHASRRWYRQRVAWKG